MHALEAAIRGLTRPLNGQFPRPWMTTMTHPEEARIFVVGYNQATRFSIESVGSHDSYIDALFNRNGRSCRDLYARARGSRGPSPTRRNLDALHEMLASAGFADVLETNVVCYSTPMGGDMACAEHHGGKAAGRAIFETILTLIRPPILIVHGVRASRELGHVLRQMLPAPAADQAAGVSTIRADAQWPRDPYAPRVFVIPSLAPPAWNAWSRWAQPHLETLCQQVSDARKHRHASEAP